METFGLCLFVSETIEKHLLALGPQGPVLRHSGQLLLQFLDTLKKCNANVTLLEQQSLLDIWKRFMKVVEPLEMYTPKFHLMYHLVRRLAFQGNALLYQTFVDESLNKTLKKVLRLCHQCAFERMALVKLAEALSRPLVRQRLF